MASVDSLDGPTVTFDSFSSESPSPSTITLAATFASGFPTFAGSVILPSPSNSQPPIVRQSSPHGLSTWKIVLITVGLLVFVLALVASISFAFVHRRQKQHFFGYDKGAESGSVSFIEKFAGGAEHNPYPESRRSFSETRGTSLLLETQTQYTGTISEFDNDKESQFFQDEPPSPFVNPNYEAEWTHQAHTASLADGTPFAHAEEEAQLDTAILHPLHSPSSKSTTSLPPLVIPHYTPPSRQPSRGKHSAHGSRQGFRAVDDGYGSDDSVSLYSQGSAATHQSAKTLPALALSALPEAVVPIIPHPSNGAYFTPVECKSGAAESTTNRSSEPPAFPPLAIILPDRGQEGKRDLEDAVVIASLLKSRRRHTATQPSRSSSIVSHIERCGSIKPALLQTADESPRSRYLRVKRAELEKMNSRLSTIESLESSAGSTTFLPSSQPPSSLINPAVLSNSIIVGSSMMGPAPLAPTIPVTPPQKAPERPRRSEARL